MYRKAPIDSCGDEQPLQSDWSSKEKKQGVKDRVRTPGGTKQVRYRMRVKERKMEEKKFWATFSRINSSTTVKDVIESEDGMKFLPEIAVYYKIGQNACRLCKFIRDGGRRSRFYGPILTKCTEGLKPSLCAKYFDRKPSQIKSTRQHCKNYNSLKDLQIQKIKPRPKRSRVSELEESLIRKWAKSKLISSGQSSTNAVKCDMTKDEFYDLYADHGCVKVYDELGRDQRYRHRVATYKPPAKGHEVDEVASLVRSIYYSQEWTQKLYDGPRPRQILPRDPRIFFRALNRRQKNVPGANKQRRDKYLKIIWSRMIHPCPLCLNSDEHIRNLQLLTSNLNDPYCKEEDKPHLERRLVLVNKQLRVLKDHKDRYESQRSELLKLEHALEKNPGTCIIWEDFGSKGKGKGSKEKMSNMILNLKYWDPKTKMIKTEFYDAFSLGTLDAKEIQDMQKNGKQDKFLYRKVWLSWFALGIFDPFDTLIKSGDNGSSIKNFYTIYMFGHVWEVYRKRVLFFTLCNYHAWNRCDPHGGHVIAAIQREQRKLGHDIGNAEKHKQFLEELKEKQPQKFKNLKQVIAVVSDNKSDEWMPDEIVRNGDLLFAIKDVCVTYPETNDIYDQRRNPERTIRRPHLLMCGKSYGAKKVAYLDLRAEIADRKNWCLSCTTRFGRPVMTSEHDQSNYWCCPKTQILTYETKETLDETCHVCGVKKLELHKQGVVEGECPSVEGNPIIPQTFPALTIHGGDPVRLEIMYEREGELTNDEITDLAIWYENRSKASWHAREVDWVMIESMTIIFHSQDPAVMISKTIPWNVGICTKTNMETKKSTILLLEQEEKEVTVWNMSFKLDGKREIEIPFSCPWRPVKLVTLYDNQRKGGWKTVPTSTIRAIAEDSRFGWNPFQENANDAEVKEARQEINEVLSHARERNLNFEEALSDEDQSQNGDYGSDNEEQDGSGSGDSDENEDDLDY